MRLCGKIVACGIALSLAAACSSSDDQKPAGTGLFGGASGSGGTSAAGAAGDAGTGGTVSDAGGTGGGNDADLPDGDAGADAGPDAPPDIVVPPLEPCPNPVSAIGSKAILAAGSTPDAFKTAYNEEVAAMAEPGPFLVEFSGLDVIDSSAGAWTFKIGPTAFVGGGPTVQFADAPGTGSFVFLNGHGIQIDTEVSFTLRFGAVDIPVEAVRIVGGFDDQCESFSVEEAQFTIPDTAGPTAFHGSTIADLLGLPNTDCCGGKENAWSVLLGGMGHAVDLQ